MKNPNTGKEEEINEQENKYRSKMDIGNFNIVPKKRTVTLYTTTRAREKMLTLESELGKTLEIVTGYDLKELEKYVKQNSWRGIESFIDCYRISRKKLINLGKDVTSFDDFCARITSKLNKIPINLN